MPRAKKPCSVPGCPNVTDTGKCISCRTEVENIRGTARNRGYDSKWEKTRRDFLRENPFCSQEYCLSLATDVDHIDGLGPLAPKGHDWSNLQPFCHRHHTIKTNLENGGGWRRR